MNLYSIARRPALALIGWSLALGASAADNQPLRVIVPAPAGGTVDAVARILGNQITQDTGRPVVVENRAGATGSIGLAAMLRADPDGNTVALGPTNMLVEAPHVIKVPFDPLKDIVSVARVAYTSYVLVTASSSPAKDFQGLVAHLKAHKGKTSFASYGTGTVSQYSGLIFSERENLGMQHVAYPGSPPALVDVVAGRVDLMFDGIVTSLPLIRSGMLRPYAVVGRKRSTHLPDVPTMSELGYPELQFQGQVNVFGSSRLPSAVLAQLQAMVRKAASAPAVEQKIAQLGLEPDVNTDTPALLAENKALSQRNAGIVRKFNIQAN